MMMGQSLPLQYGNVDYLQNLKVCLSSSKGREYLFRFLQQSMYLYFMCHYFFHINCNIHDINSMV